MNTNIRIIVPTNGEDWHEMWSERVWASVVDGGRYRIENYPLYAYGLSYGDVVAASPVQNGDFLFSKKLTPGGHSTYRLLLRRGTDRSEFERYWPELSDLGCRYESSADPEDVFAIDVPPDSDVNAVYAVLVRGVSEGLWHLDEGDFGH